MHREAAKVAAFGQAQVAPLQQRHHPGSFLVSSGFCTTVHRASVVPRFAGRRNTRKGDPQLLLFFYGRIIPTWALFLVEQMSVGEAEAEA